MKNNINGKYSQIFHFLYSMFITCALQLINSSLSIRIDHRIQFVERNKLKGNIIIENGFPAYWLQLKNFLHYIVLLHCVAGAPLRSNADFWRLYRLSNIMMIFVSFLFKEANISVNFWLKIVSMTMTIDDIIVVYLFSFYSCARN